MPFKQSCARCDLFLRIMPCFLLRFYSPAFLVHMYVTHWVLNSGYGIKFFIDYDGNHSDDNDDDNNESHNYG